MSTTACPSNTTSTTSPSAAFPPDLVSLFKNHQQSATTEQPQPSPDNDDDDDNEDAGSWDGGCQKEEDGDDTNEAGHTKTTSIPAANNDYLKEDCNWVNFGKCSNTKISDVNPALPTPHAGLFETIAKLAGIDTGQQAVQHEIGEQNGADETPAIDQTLLDSILNPAQQPGSTTCSSTSSSSSSSRRKNGNPTRISDENGTTMVKEEGKEDGADEVNGVGENGTEMEEEAGTTDAEGTVAEESEETENGNEEGPKAKRRPSAINGIANHASSNGTLQPPPPSFGPAFPFSFAQQPQGLLEEQQRRVFAAAQQLAAAQQNQQHQQPQQMFNRLAQQLKEEFAGMLAAGTGDKDPQQQQLPAPIDSFSAQEAQAQLGRLLASFSMAARQHQWMAELGGFLASAGSAMGGQPPQQPNPRSPFPSRAPAASHFVPPAAAAALANPFHALLAQNPLMAAAMMAASAGHQQQQQHQQHFQPTTATTSGQQQPAFGANGGGSIFPGGQPNGFMATPRPFAPLPPAQQQQHQSHHQQQRREFAFRSAADTDGSPRKKRAKVTDSVRGPRSSLHNLREPNAGGGNYSSTSERSTPQGCFPAPPTMVPLGSLHHPHPHQLLFRSPERNGHGASPAGGNNNNNDDDGSDRNSLGGDVQQQQMHSAQLTHVHLRKAKLMFFYQRYPSSAVLKSYFPDVQFNKHNTAQLVKWFSNFREFWYMCMEKFAKQAMAEGFTQREELLITTDSELFKQLNQHYNKNGVFQPPEKLQFVVQETLREFFTALQHQKDTEPSWKKAIYKVIQQLDEPIPEYFRDPQFVEMLEKTT